ncbi:MAG: nucleotidyltransferase domain-containing protein [Thermoflexales bacterium]|nr:nucleotidyltransferase domain-containing protein [Thermoflexales bacterium]
MVWTANVTAKGQDSALSRVIGQIVRRIVEGYHPQKIVLFGSLAWGEPDEDSDIDLLIIKETEESPLERRVRVRRLVSDIRRWIPFSPLVLTPEELAHRLSIGDPFYQEIIRRGLVLYERK